MTDWAGNKQRQEFIVGRIMRNSNLARENPVDVAGAAETIIANMICDLSPDVDTALRGLEAAHGDMVRVVKHRFGVEDQ